MVWEKEKGLGGNLLCKRLDFSEGIRQVFMEYSAENVITRR